MKISVCYATPKKQVEIPLEVGDKCTIALAINRSGILQQFPEINLKQVCVGVYSKRTSMSENLHEGDRVEIYRSLFVDPQTARLLRAKRSTKK